MPRPELTQYDPSRPYIKGKLSYEIFHNTENYYTVSKVKVLESTEEIDAKEVTVVGYYPPLLEGETYLFWGRFKEHPKFGRQYHLDYFQKEIPQGTEGLIAYLSSDLFPGIGKKTAERIVDTLGEEAVALILEDPAVLKRVPRLTEEQRAVVHQRLLEYQGLEQIMQRLGQYGIGLGLSVQIYQTYGDKAIQVIEENPYKLMEDIEGIGFKRADTIARAMGIPVDAPQRIRAACLHLIEKEAEDNGHVYVPLDQAVQRVEELLNQSSTSADTGEVNIEPDAVEEHLIRLAQEELLILEEDRLYLPSLFFAERGFAKKVKRLLNQTIQLPVSYDQLLKIIGQVEDELGLEYAPSQREAIEQALKSPLIILTGGPGTGKTTVIKGIVHCFARLYDLSVNPRDYVKKGESFPFLLVAPTGRAAKRLAESTGVPAFTIHRLLGWKGGQVFEYDDEHRLSGKLLIVDESSMMDQWLANQLFRALPDDIQVVLVGDQDQLPSVGPGQVLTDLLRCTSIPVVQLQDIFRQASHSTIITLAHQIKAGDYDLDLFSSKPDFRFFPCSATQVVNVVGQICQLALSRGFTFRDIQVLAPMYKGDAGIHALNKHLQATFNPPSPTKKELVWGEHRFRVGDKVLQLVNNVDHHVYNGDIGQVLAILDAEESAHKEEEVVVQFDEHEVRYRKNDLNQLTLAYCCSIHKAQGSEYPIVIIPIVNSYWRMLKRNLLYTAVTRGKEYLFFCGEEQAIKMAIQRQEVAKRFTTLTECIEGEDALKAQFW